MAVEATRAEGFAVGPSMKRRIAKRYAATNATDKIAAQHLLTEGIPK